MILAKQQQTNPRQLAEKIISYEVKHTISGVDLEVLPLRIVADPNVFTDLRTAKLVMELRVLKNDNSPITAADNLKPFFDNMGGNSLFSKCVLKFDGVEVSTMDYYPYSALICRWYGSIPENRQMWKKFDASYTNTFGSSDMSSVDDTVVAPMITAVENSGTFHLTTRIYSDVLMSTRQYLPPGVEIGIELRRAPSAFTLCCKTRPNDSVKVDSKDPRP